MIVVIFVKNYGLAGVLKKPVQGLFAANVMKKKYQNVHFFRCKGHSWLGIAVFEG